MKSSSSNILRPLSEFEKSSINPTNKLFVQFALEFTDKKYLPTFLSMITNATTGLYVKSDGDNFLSSFKDPDHVTVHQLPRYLKTLPDCCEWIYRTYSPSPNYSLASIAADETRLIVNSSHSLTDGGFYLNLLQNIQNPTKKELFNEQFPLPSDLIDCLFKDQFKKFKENFNSKFFNLKQTDFTYLNLQEKVSLPDPYDDIPHRFRAEIEYNELSPFIYDKKLRKINSKITDLLSAGLCLSINAKNGQFGPIGFCNCFDFRNLVPNEENELKFGNSFSIYFLAIENVNHSISINEICSIFRNKLNYLRSNNFLYKELLFPFDYARINSPIAVVSNLGKIRFKSPIKDFYLQDTEKDESCKPIIQLTSYSKINENDLSNKLILYLRASNSVVSVKNTKEIFETLIHFLKSVNPSNRVGDVFDELIHFQNSVSL